MGNEALRRGWSWCLASGILALSRIAAFSAEATPIDFFETKIRPLFAEHCYSCHSDKAKKIKGDLRFDTPEALLKGGGSGPAFVPGDPDASLLIKAVRYSDPDLQMPPKNKKLSSEEIAALEAWVKMGAPMPKSAAPKAADSIAEARAKHWSFQPVHKPEPPKVSNGRWLQTPIDNFVLALLEKNRLKPAVTADRRTLIRRVTYDLTGLPPTPEEVDAFLHDTRAGAYADLVERLLASPRYGERWGRYWLDVARFADTKGYLAGGEERRYPFSYTYRDYVIRAFNEDEPYNRFITEQIAADKLPLGADKRPLAALGFLTLGRRFLGNQNDIIDDRIDVVSRGTVGLTVACARCHDHKFDPIPTRDYYALHGVFASSDEPAEEPLLGEVSDSPDYKAYLKEKAAIEAEIPKFKDGEIAEFLAELRKDVGEYMLGARDAALLPDSTKFETFAGERKLKAAVLRRWITYLEACGKTNNPIFQPWFELAKVSETNYSATAKSVLDKLTSANSLVVKALAGQGTNSLKAASEVYTKLFKGVDDDWNAALQTAAKATNAPPTSLKPPEQEALRQVLYAVGTAVNVPRAESETILNRRLTEGSAPIRNRIQALSWTYPGAPPRAMALEDRATPVNSPILKRGNPSTPGDVVPRGFVQILNSPRVTGFTNGSGRLELAEVITDPKNPLTARVYVNRVWLHHFGEGLVSTAGDFGIRTEEPIHRALLDYLATAFMEHGWSTKYLHRLILLSATYQQSADASPETIKVDPENRLWGRMNRQRLDFEAMRDTLLAVSGKLDTKLGGLPVDILAEPFSPRRTVYAYIERQNLPGLFRTFDFANPDISNQGRFRTTVPQQALFMMNSPFVIDQARHLSQRMEIKAGPTAKEKLRRLYQIVLQRNPTQQEIGLGQRFLISQQHGAAPFSSLEKYSQVLLLSNELMFVD